MKIQLFDRGTPAGKKLFSDIKIVCQRLQVDYDPEMITDMHRVVTMGVQGKTVLLIDNDIALVDKYPSLSELENIISDYLK